jgi:uridine phosphorylase
MADPIHLRPQCPVAERVLLPGDPGRALRLAQALTDGPRMLNHHRGLWGYTGTASDGESLSIQSTGMGGPSAAIVVEELIALGARRLVRVGSCGALAGDLELGELVAPARVLSGDGASRALGAPEEQTPDPALLERLLARARAGTAVSTDLFYDDGVRAWSERGADVVEMEGAAVLAVAAAHDVPAAVVLAVSDVLVSGRERIRDDALHDAELRMGELGLAALG